MSDKTTNFFDLRRTKSRFSQIEQRLNLQDLGHHIRNGGDLLTLQSSSFDERENTAIQELQEALLKRFDEKTFDELMPIIEKYNDIKQDICFSLGMKVGARLISLLTGGNFESDF